MSNLIIRLNLLICMIVSLSMVSCLNNQIQQFISEFNADWAGEKIDNITVLKAEIYEDNIILNFQINNVTFGDSAQEMADEFAESDMSALCMAIIIEGLQEYGIDICCTNYNVILRYYDSSGETIDVFYENRYLESFYE